MSEPRPDGVPPGVGAAASAGGDERTGLALTGRDVRLLLLGAAALLLVWIARGILGPFVVAGVLAYAFAPVVSGVQARTGLPRVVVIAVGYLIALAALGALGVLLANRIGTELRDISSAGPDVIATALHRFVGDHLTIAGQQIQTDTLATEIRDALFGLVKTPSDAIHMAEQAVDVALQAVLTLIITFYFLLDGHRFGSFAARFLDGSRRERAVHIANRIHVVLGRWLRGQLFLIALVSLVLYVILGPILHVRYALILAILSGVLEILPLVGPIAAAALAGTVAFANGGTNQAVVVLAVYLVVRQVEDQIVMPVVIGRAVHLHPVATIFAVLVGLSGWGILGGLLGVPVAAAINVTLHELFPDETARDGHAEPAAAGMALAASTGLAARGPDPVPEPPIAPERAAEPATGSEPAP